MRKGMITYLVVIAAIASSFFMNAYAVAPGFYMGFMFGPATNNGKPTYINATSPPVFGNVVLAEPRAQQYGARLFMGNQINSIISFEGGLTLFSNIQFKGKSNLPRNPTGEARVRVFDLVAKAAVPFRNIADVYVKAGGAVVYFTTSGSLNQSGKGTYRNKFSPTGSVGATYDFNQSWVADVSYTILPIGNSSVKTVNFFAVGFSYHFVDVYCGQFLCDD